jgi:triacylglycerol lipase
MPLRTGIIGLILLMSVAHNSHSASAPPCGERDLVVVLHGMGRTKISMSWLAGRLEQQGYDVLNFSYPSTRSSVTNSTAHLHQELQTRLPARAGRIHFVTHSLGGIVVRAYLKQHHPANLGRVVMLSPPNQGSEVVDKLRGNFLYRLITGPAGQELGTEKTSTPNALGEVNFTLGVITGDRSFNPLFSSWLSGPDDGKVSVQRAKVSGMADFLVVPHSHSFIMRSSTVARQVAHFLEHGRFNSPAS